MLSNRWTIRSVTAIIALAAVSAVILGAGSVMSHDRVGGLSKHCECPRVEIIELRSQIARLDTATGELSLMSGDPTRASGRGQWQGYAGRIGTYSPGTFTIRSVRGAVFLVNIENGETWALSTRGPGASWRRVGVRR